MAGSEEFVLGEYRRTLDERCRLSVPLELADTLLGPNGECILAKERPGCLSLWRAELWQEKIDDGVELVKRKMRAGKLEGRLPQVQMLGRLLSTRHQEVQLGDRGRLVVPPAFREFLSAEPGSEVMIIGAAVCIEIWSPPHWLEYLKRRMPKFRRLFDNLSS